MFSIIIPLFNAEKYIGRLLDSIFAQDYDNYEIIVVNDGSTDKSLQIIKKYIPKNKIILKNIDNSGPGFARKLGYLNSSGDYLFFIDSDDYLPSKDILKNLNEKMSSSNCDILFFNYQYCINSQGNYRVSSSFYSKKFKDGLYTIEALEKLPIGGALWQKIFRKSKMKEEYFYNSNTFEDYYTTYMYLNECNNFYFYNKECYFYEINNNYSLSKNYDMAKISLTVDLLITLYSKVKLKKSLSQMIFRYYYYCIRILENKNLNIGKECSSKLNELKKYISYKNLIYTKDKLKYLYIKIKT